MIHTSATRVFTILLICHICITFPTLYDLILDKIRKPHTIFYGKALTETVYPSSPQQGATAVIESGVGLRRIKFTPELA